MSDYNKVILSGRLTRNAETRSTNSGMTVVEFGFASNRKVKNKEEETTFVDCTMFGDRAATLAEYLVKGKSLIIDGSLRLETWEKDGQKRSKLSVVVDNITFLSNGNQASELTAGVVEKVNNSVCVPDLSESTVPF